MKRLLLLLLVSALWATPPTIRRSDLTPLRGVDFDPMLVPDVEEDVFSKSVYLTEITLTNVTAGAVVVTVKDKQGTPRNVLGPLTIAANTTYVIRFDARNCPGGVRWSADTASAVVGYMRGLQSGSPQ